MAIQTFFSSVFISQISTQETMFKNVQYELRIVWYSLAILRGKIIIMKYKFRITKYTQTLFLTILRNLAFFAIPICQVQNLAILNQNSNISQNSKFTFRHSDFFLRNCEISHNYLYLIFLSSGGNWVCFVCSCWSNRWFMIQCDCLDASALRSSARFREIQTRDGRRAHAAALASSGVCVEQTSRFWGCVDESWADLLIGMHGVCSQYVKASSWFGSLCCEDGSEDGQSLMRARIMLQK